MIYIKFLLKILLILVVADILIFAGLKLYYTYHYRNQPIFQNPDPAYKPKGLLQLLRWKLFTKRTPWPDQVKLIKEDSPPDRVPDLHRMRVSFIGHVTFLIQTNNMNILTDPVWADRASPFSFIGPKRVIDPGIKLENLPKIDVMLISHNHYDHMDLATIKYLWQRDKPTIITPLQNDVIIKNYIQDSKLNITTLNWQENIKLANHITINLEPAQHWSARGLFDRNRALWGNFIIETTAGNICFIADSGYNQSLYKQLGEKYEIFLSLIPIGSFEPRWFMGDIHMNPLEAVLTHQDLQAKYSIANHFQTFKLASDGYLQARQELVLALQQYGISSDEFITPQHGRAYWFDARNH
jgi:L-ascorbate metabolism protein UlaG (beta-lactamase superfamily)